MRLALCALTASLGGVIRWDGEDVGLCNRMQTSEIQALRWPAALARPSAGLAGRPQLLLSASPHIHWRPRSMAI